MTESTGDDVCVTALWISVIESACDNQSSMRRAFIHFLFPKCQNVFLWVTKTQKRSRPHEASEPHGAAARSGWRLIYSTRKEGAVPTPRASRSMHLKNCEVRRVVGQSSRFSFWKSLKNQSLPWKPFPDLNVFSDSTAHWTICPMLKTLHLKFRALTLYFISSWRFREVPSSLCGTINGALKNHVLKVLWDTLIGSLKNSFRKRFFKEPWFERFSVEP